jgi:hypothetical protein
MYLGESLRTIVIEPIEDPADEMIDEPDESSAPEALLELVPVPRAG